MDSVTPLSTRQRLATAGLLALAVSLLAAGAVLGGGGLVPLLLLPVAGCGAAAFLVGGRTMGTTVTIAVSLVGAAALLSAGSTPVEAGLAAALVSASVLPVGHLALTHLGRIEARADVDRATGLATRSAILDELDRARAGAARREGHLAVLAIDLPGLWTYADEKGPAAGESLLRATADAWRDALRPDDRIGRLRGARFLVVLPGCEGDDALTVADRMRSVAPISTEVVVAGAAVPYELSTADLLQEMEETLVTAARWGDGLALASPVTEPSGPLPSPVPSFIEAPLPSTTDDDEDDLTPGGMKALLRGFVVANPEFGS